MTFIGRKCPARVPVSRRSIICPKVVGGPTQSTLKANTFLMSLTTCRHEDLFRCLAAVGIALLRLVREFRTSPCSRMSSHQVMSQGLASPLLTTKAPGPGHEMLSFSPGRRQRLNARPPAPFTVQHGPCGLTVAQAFSARLGNISVAVGQAKRGRHSTQCAPFVCKVLTNRRQLVLS